MTLASARESSLIISAALVVGLLLFGVFVAAIGKSPLEVYVTIYEGAFASSFSWQNTLLRAAPLILTGLAVAIPAQAGLMVIGAEGTLVLGGLATAAVAALLNTVTGMPALPAQAVALLAGCLAGACWLGLTGLLRAKRGLNETIVSLLLSYIAIALFNHLVEGALRDPGSLNKPSTAPIDERLMIGNIFGLDVHWGLVIGIVCALAAQIVLSRTTWGYALRVTGGNQRAAKMAGFSVTTLLVAACAFGGAAAGLAGGIEVLAVHGAANASLIVGYGYTGILVAFLARQQPLGVVPVAILMGGIGAAGSLLQRRLDLPDATTLVLQGMLFICILAADALTGRIKFGRGRATAARATEITGAETDSGSALSPGLSPGSGVAAGDAAGATALAVVDEELPVVTVTMAVEGAVTAIAAKTAALSDGVLQDDAVTNGIVVGNGPAEQPV
jgi:simple sugar transport system permease protein